MCGYHNPSVSLKLRIASVTEINPYFWLLAIKEGQWNNIFILWWYTLSSKDFISSKV